MMTEASTIDLAALPGPSRGTLLRRRVLAHKGLMIGGAVLAVIVIGALLAPWLAPEDPFAQDLTRRLIPPVWYAKGSWAHAFGTDNLGRDYLSRMIFGARISLLIGVSVMVISGLFGTALGLAAGYLGGRTDMAVMFLITVRLALPLILVALAVVATIGGSLVVVVLVIGLLKWERFAVVTRAATQQVRALDYVAAAECIGGIAHPQHPRRDSAEHCAATVGGRHHRGGKRHSAGGGVVVPRPRCAAAGAVLGPDDRRGQELHVLLVLADRDSGYCARDPGARHQHGGRRHPRCRLAGREELT
jgi:hypothetical protein